MRRKMIIKQKKRKNYHQFVQKIKYYKMIHVYVIKNKIMLKTIIINANYVQVIPNQVKQLICVIAKQNMNTM